MAKILKHFYLEPKQVRYLERESERTGKSQAKIVRELIEDERQIMKNNHEAQSNHIT